MWGIDVGCRCGCRCRVQVWVEVWGTGIGCRSGVQVWVQAGMGSGAGFTQHTAFQETGEAQKAELEAAKTDCCRRLVCAGPLGHYLL